MNGPQASLLGRRLHLNHGPIDLIVEAFGEDDEVEIAYRQAVQRFDSVLTGLVGELPALRRPVSGTKRNFLNPIACTMEKATQQYHPEFITPMAAVAGAVADEVLAATVRGRCLRKAYVNNGGDSALFLGSGETIQVAIAGTGHGFADRITIHATDPVRGVATSGWRGRSFSLGIADAVTVLARTGAEADAAATLIANAVDLPGHPAIRRAPASRLQPDSDLGERLVTTDVGTLDTGEICQALDSGLEVAEEFRRCGRIVSAALFLCGHSRYTGAGLPYLFPTGQKPIREIASHG